MMFKDARKSRVTLIFAAPICSRRELKVMIVIINVLIFRLKFVTRKLIIYKLFDIIILKLKLLMQSLGLFTFWLPVYIFFSVTLSIKNTCLRSPLNVMRDAKKGCRFWDRQGQGCGD